MATVLTAKLLRTLRGVYRARTVLLRLIADAERARDKAAARELHGVLTALQRAGGFIMGGEPPAWRANAERRRERN